ncbi:hypothetical protein ABI59_09235 [Acidobacteria bacterium Mor1]|nr:hypothetical protein ABI59_09235 [Acidobacteria bacterium Mor1]
MRDVEMPASDGFKLAATVFEKGGPDALVINSATGVPRRFYRHCAAWFAERGYQVVTYDYRGIGDSGPGRLRGFKARARDWGLQDMRGALEWVQATYAPRKTFVLGHSIGGQLPGLIENTSAIAGMVGVSAQSGYWGVQGGSEKQKVWFYMYVLFPLLTTIYGYLPWRMFGSGEDLPLGVAREWSSWCRSRRYLFDDATLPLHNYQRFTSPILAYSFVDDAWGTRRAVDEMMSGYSASDVERRHVGPDDVGMKRIGHVGFFRPEGERLWEQALSWFGER